MVPPHRLRAEKEAGAYHARLRLFDRRSLWLRSEKLRIIPPLKKGALVVDDRKITRDLARRKLLKAVCNHTVNLVLNIWIESGLPRIENLDALPILNII